MSKSKPRATRTTLDCLPEASPEVKDAAILAAQTDISTLFASRACPFRVKVKLDDRMGFIVDGKRKTIEPLVGNADLGIRVRLSDLNLMILAELDPRQAMVFGGMVVESGSVSHAIAFGDFLTGTSVQPLSKRHCRVATLTRDWGQARKDLEEFGYALVEGAMPRDELVRVRDRLVGQAASERAAGKASIGESAQRVWNLINKGREFHDLLLNPLIETMVPSHIGQHALLHGYVAQIALPGNAPSIMHYDQISVQPKVNFQVGLNLLWFLDDVSDANGGTRIAPGSHLQHVGPADPFDTEGTVAAAGPAGTALLLDSRTWHSVGNNITDEPRHVIASYFVRSYMRTQENYFLSLLPEVYKSLDDRVRVMLGFRCTGSLGGVEGPIEGKMVTWPDSPIGELSGPLS